MKHAWAILLAAGAGLISAGGAEAAMGKYAANFLRITPTARAAAIADAGATLTGVESIFMNPAGLTRITKNELIVSHAAWLEGISYSNAAFAAPIPFGALGIGVNYLGVPAIDKYDNAGRAVGESYRPSAMAVTAGWGRFVAGFLDAGLNLKYVSQTIDGTTASAYAFDAGCRCIFLEGRVAAAAVLQNLGSGMKYHEQTSPLPLNLKLGVVYGISRFRKPVGEFELLLSKLYDMAEQTNSAELRLDVNCLEDGTVNAGAGAEYYFFVGDVTLVGRAGYKINQNRLDALHGISAGLGLCYRDITFDYAFVPYGDLGSTSRVTLGIRFDRILPAKKTAIEPLVIPVRTPKN